MGGQDNQEGLVVAIGRYGVDDARVLTAVLGVDRSLFVRDRPYADMPVSIGFGQSASQPYTVARMIELLIQNTKTQDLKGASVLEIGTGSGWQTAILAKLFKQVYSIEKIPQLAKKAKQKINDLGFANIEIKIGDGKLGWLDHAPYQGIIVSADAAEVPQPVVDQLDEGGKIVIPVRGEMMRGVKERGKMYWESFGIFSFVPLV